VAPCSREETDGGGPGYVKPEFRGGFLDLWEGANALEHTTHPYEGTIYTGSGDRDSKEIRSRMSIASIS